MVNPERLHELNGLSQKASGPILYWMQRDMRAQDNWALLYAQQQARALHLPLMVCFALAPSFAGATLRAYDALIRGLQEVEDDLRRLNIPFVLLTGDPPEQVGRLLSELRPALLVTDFNPLPIVVVWKKAVVAAADCRVVEVDAHNIVPARIASDHQEWSAATLRRKLGRLLQTWLVEIPAVTAFPAAALPPPTNWNAARRTLTCDSTVAPAVWFAPGTRAGMKHLREFRSGALRRYPDLRNDPTVDGTSRLSPWLHFGQISAQRAALEVQRSVAPVEAVQAFLEQLIVRRELADNWCLYNPACDSTRSFPEWARRTLEAHAQDPREHTYTLEQLDLGLTHDPLWNAAQHRLRSEGYLHGYLRMYWAKQVLLWTLSADEALQDILWLNDRYELDGRDPNGYVGAAWSIGGVHDRPWPQHPIFGSIRSMTLSGARNKFDVQRYISASLSRDATNKS